MPYDTTRYTPHYAAPTLENVHVVVVYRNFMAKRPNWCHIGLGVNGLHTVKVLRQNRIRADLFGVWELDDIVKRLRDAPTATHCVIEAVWVGTQQMQTLLRDFPHVHFIVRAHSEVGFLQVEPGAITLLRDQMIMAEQELNLTIAANSHRLSEFLRSTYNAHVLFLPNLYDLERVTRKRPVAHGHRVLRISSFGALRWLKNHTTAAAAALSIARARGCDLEFFMSVEREEHGKTVLDSVRNLFRGLPWATLREVPWAQWAEFRRLVGTMDLTLQVSFTESFNLCTSDSVAEGVPAVVSYSIDWAPDSWKASPDEIEDIVRIGCNLLSNPNSAEEGLRALQSYCDKAGEIWKQYLREDPARTYPVRRLR